MTKSRFAALLCLSVIASPLAAQTALTERPGRWITVEPSDTSAPQILTAPDAAPLIGSRPAPEVVVLEHPAIASVAPQQPTVRTPRPQPRRFEISATVPVEAAPEPSEPTLLEPVDVSPIEIVARPAPTQRPVARPAIAPDLGAAVQAALEAVGAPDAAVLALDEPSIPDVEVIAETEAATPEPEILALAPVEVAPSGAFDVTDVAALAAELAAELAGDAHAIMAAATGVAPARGTAADPVGVAALAPAPLAPTPVALNAVVQMSSRNQPAALSAVLLPDAAFGTRPLAQPVAFMVPHTDQAPVLSRPLPEAPGAAEQMPGFDAVSPERAALVLTPDASTVPTMPRRLRMAMQPALDLFPYSALPPERLPGGPDSLVRAIQPPAPRPEAMAAVLMTDPRPGPARVPDTVRPNLPAIGEAPMDPDRPPILPEPDLGALARMISDAEICWRYADLGVEARWARLSVEVALDETNMPTTHSIRLTGFGRVMSSDADEAYRAARGALIGCAEATTAEAATQPATLIFDRNGVRLR